MDNSLSLKIESLSLQNFRNYSLLQLDNLGNFNIFIGKNAVGKTNIIEALQLISDLKSFRSNQLQQCIQWGFNHAKVNAIISNKKQIYEESLFLTKEKRTYTLNKKKKTKKELKGLLPAVIFSPDDLELIKGTHSKRRDSVDNLGIQLSKNFYSVYTDYQKLIKQKNQALKDELSRSLIESINEILYKVAAQYIIFRLTLLQKFEPHFSYFYHEITQESEVSTLEYNFSWGEKIYIKESEKYLDKKYLQTILEEALHQAFNDEKERKRSLIGPHADQILFFFSPSSEEILFRNAYDYASQGQQRSLVLAFKMAEIRTIQETIYKQPILLLDDVMSELDETRRRMFTKLVQEETQTFITTTDLSYFDDDIIQKATIFHLPLKE